MNNMNRLSVGCLLLSTISCSGFDDSTEVTSTAVSALEVPIAQTGTADRISQINARLGVTVTDSGTSQVTECGVCWGTSSTPSFVEQLGAEGTRCMRQLPCLNAAYYTNNGYMAQRSYVPGATYYYRGYAINSSGISYGNVATFSVPKVNTGASTDVTTTQARLGVTVDNMAASGVTECGVCWGSSSSIPGFVEQVGAEGVRCMRQIPCLNAAYFTGDGYMAQRPYVVGATYNYRAYAINDAGIAYGETKSFKAGQCYAYTVSCWDRNPKNIFNTVYPFLQFSTARECVGDVWDSAKRSVPSNCLFSGNCSNTSTPSDCCCTVNQVREVP